MGQNPDRTAPLKVDHKLSTMKPLRERIEQDLTRFRQTQFPFPILIYTFSNHPVPNATAFGTGQSRTARHIGHPTTND
jgi:hypothetical protein